MKQLFSNELLSACTKIAGHSTMFISNALPWLCLVFHVITPSVSSITNWPLQSIRTWSVPMCPGYSSMLLTFQYDEMFWPCLSTDTCTKHGFTPTLWFDVLLVIRPAFMSYDSWISVDLIITATCSVAQSQALLRVAKIWLSPQKLLHESLTVLVVTIHLCDYMTFTVTAQQPCCLTDLYDLCSFVELP
jgi:hypothetical protein